jgi:hypothetical protein
MITLAMQHGGEGQEVQLEALRQQIEALPKPKRGDRKAARLQHDKGLAEFKKERYAQALQLFLTAYQLDAGDVEVVNNVGMAYLKTGNLPEAARYLGGALSLAPNRAAAWGNLAEVFARNARLEEAVAAYALTYRYSKNKDATRRLLEAQTTNVDDPQVMQPAKAALALPLISGQTASGEDAYRGLAEKKLGKLKEQPAPTPPVPIPVPTPTPRAREAEEEPRKPDHAGLVQMSENSPIILALDGMDWGATCAATPSCITATAVKLAAVAAVSLPAALEELEKFIELSGGRPENYLAEKLSSQWNVSTCAFKAQGPFCSIYTVPWRGGIANNDEYLNYISLTSATILALAKKFPIRPFVVVAHSWGSVVAFNVLEDLSANELTHPVELLVTLGSPLQTDNELVKIMVNSLPGEIPGKNYVLTSKLSRPKSVKHWVNFYVSGSGLQSDFIAMSNTSADENIKLPPASISFPQTHADYFDNPSNATAMLDAITRIGKTTSVSIEQADFANFTFPLSAPEKDCAGLSRNTVPLRRGEFKDTSQNVELGVEVSLGKILYADLTGDHINEATVPLYCNPHGNYVDTVTFIYTLHNGEPILLGSFGNSNTERDYRQYYPDGFVFPAGGASVANGKLLINRVADGSHACPENDVRFEYLWNGKNFALAGRPVKYPLRNCGAEEKPPSPPVASPILTPTPRDREAERPRQEAASQQAIQSAASRCTGDQIEKMINAGFPKQEIARLCDTTEGLDRDAAKKLIQANAKFSEPVSVVPMNIQPSELALREGILVDPFRNGRWQPSEEGKKYFTSIIPHTYMVTLANPLHREVVEVTGITEGSGGSQKLVNFTWRYRNLSDTIVRYTGLRRDHDATAVFRKYDDGWRVDEITQR